VREEITIWGFNRKDSYMTNMRETLGSLPQDPMVIQAWVVKGEDDKNCIWIAQRDVWVPPLYDFPLRFEVAHADSRKWRFPNDECDPEGFRHGFKLMGSDDYSEFAGFVLCNEGRSLLIIDKNTKPWKYSYKLKLVPVEVGSHVLTSSDPSIRNRGD